MNLEFLAKAGSALKGFRPRDITISGPSMERIVKPIYLARGRASP